MENRLVWKILPIFIIAVSAGCDQSKTKDRATPLTAETKQFEGVKISNFLNQNASEFRAYLLENYKPLLRIDPKVSIRPLQTKTERINGAVKTVFWARRAADSFGVEWASGKITKESIDSSAQGDSVEAQVIPPEMLLRTSGKNKLFLRKGNGGTPIPWEHEGVVYPLALDPNYMFAFGTLVKSVENVKKTESLVVVNVAEGKVVANLPLPDETLMGVHCVFKPDQDVLLIFDTEWKWILCLDLKTRN